MIATLIIFVGTYLVVAVGRVPGLRLDRTGAALIGAALMVATGAIAPAEAYRAIDFDTLTLLLGMMMVVANLRLAGFFGLCHALIASRAHRAAVLLIGVTAIAGTLSAVLVNDTVCVMLTPLVIDTARGLRRNPVPYLLALATASNAGSSATMTGNPQNMMIASVSRIAYGDFAAQLAPVAVAALVIIVVVIVVVWRREFWPSARIEAGVPFVVVNRALLVKTLLVTVAIIAAFFVGVPPALAAILGGSLLFVTRRIKPQRVYRDIDWSLLLLFVGLFVVVAAMERAVLTPDRLTHVRDLPLNRTLILALTTAVLSNLVSNVPAVLVLKPLIGHLADPRHGWLVLGMASTLAGNFTILGSVANLIVVQGAERRGVKIGFWTYFLVGAPVTLVSLALGILWLSR
jgi:Na+/H+ antiporter NhaD/arsenite permease-like protein